MSGAHMRGTVFMMKNLKMRFFVASLAMFSLAGALQPAQADIAAKPIVNSFTLSQDVVDLASGNTKVTIDLVVSNPTGISSSQTIATLSDGGANSAVLPLVRTDSPMNNALQTVKFEGTVNIATLPAGAYSVTAAPITGLNANGTTGLPTDVLTATTSSKVVGAKNALLIRSNGDLNFAYSTFIGPAFNKSLGNVYVNPNYNTVSAPIWKVGEVFNPTDYYEITVPSLALKVKTTTPSVCSTDGVKLNLIATGACSFTVYTDKTSDYRYFNDDQTVTVTAARVKPTYVISKIPTQSSATLPLSIQGPYVMSPSGLVTPTTATPSVCYGAGFYITIISGGTCTLNYASPGDANYLPSDVYTLSFEISRTAQTVSLTAPSTVALAAKSVALSATASSGQLVTFLSSTPNVCSVTGSSLNLLAAGTCHITASQIGTATIAPASADQNIVITGGSSIPKTASKPSVKATKKLVCVKNGKTQIFTSKKCPSGYKTKK
jgi:hypothetical protein